MKKLLSILLMVQLVLFLTGCCCPCCKKPGEQKPQGEPQPAKTEPAK